jgi:hypothetical protein
MAGRYPDILFHFTNTKEALFGILSDNFKISYAREKICGSREVREFAAPMVSFCDLRLSEVASHMDAYGEYGIGLTKEWAVRNGLNPVAYWSAGARLIDNLFDIMGAYFEDTKGEPDCDKSLTKQLHYRNLIDIYRFIKNYEGPLKRRDGTCNPNFRYADEREWRYVPLSNEVEPFINIDRFNQKEKAHWNGDIGCRLEFDPDDIRYIIVATESERMAVIEHIRNGTGKGKKYGEEAVTRLASRILTAGQIRDDV